MNILSNVWLISENGLFPLVLLQSVKFYQYLEFCKDTSASTFGFNFECQKLFFDYQNYYKNNNVKSCDLFLRNIV